MGYIHFHGVDVPRGNVVPLRLLNRQLQRQCTNQPATDSDKDFAGLDEGQAFVVTETELQDKEQGQSVQNLGLEGENLLDLLTINYSQCVNLAMQPSSGLRAVEKRPLYEPSSLDEELSAGMFLKSGALYISSPSDSCDSAIFVETPPNSTNTIKASLCVSERSSLHSVEQPLQEPLRCNLSNSSAASYQCPHCPSNFRVRGYLTRHLKKHMPTKEFHCPYWSTGCKCHPSGEFSRKDTFRTHLKSIHFVYPVGTTKAQRSDSLGRCAACYEEFKNNKDWLKYHIDAGLCKVFSSRTSQQNVDTNQL